MDTVMRNGFLSPVVNRGIRKPFGELTNTPPNKRPYNENTPSKHPDCSTPTALTPMANLKLLMRVAAEKAELEQQQPSRRELFKEENEDDEEDRLVVDENRLVMDHDYSSSGMLTPSSNCSSMSGSGKVSRKDKSLGLLCDKFIERFPREVPPGDKCEIPLDDLAKQMSTERRRIYDIVNVLEAVQMMTKVGKNLYQWHGTTHQLMTLAWLRQLGVKLNLLQRYHDVKQMEAEEILYGLPSPRNERDLKRSPLSQLSSSATSSQLSSQLSSSANSSFTSSPASSCSPSPSPVDRKTSLGVACQKFLMLFLIVQEPQAKINLDVAAKVIHGIGLPDAIMKTRIRRLYDIANILQSLKLIQKVQITEMHGGKKPAFQYIGPTLDGVEVSRDILQSLPSTRQRHSLLTFGKNLLNLSDDPQEAFAHSRSNSSNDENGHQAPLNLVKREFAFAVPRNCASPVLKRSHSLMDLGEACDRERNHQVRFQPKHSPTTQHLMQLKPIQSLSSQRQLFKSPGAGGFISPSSPGVSLLKRALTAPQVSPRSSSSVQFIQLSSQNGGSAPPSQVMQLVGLERSKTVIALVQNGQQGLTRSSSM